MGTMVFGFSCARHNTKAPVIQAILPLEAGVAERGSSDETHPMSLSGFVQLSVKCDKLTGVPASYPMFSPFSARLFRNIS